jgi:hypothetical protein
MLLVVLTHDCGILVHESVCIREEDIEKQGALPLDRSMPCCRPRDAAGLTMLLRLHNVAAASQCLLCWVESLQGANSLFTPMKCF